MLNYIILFWLYYLSECPDSIYTLILRKGGLCGKNGVMKLASHLLLKMIDKNSEI